VGTVLVSKIKYITSNAVKRTVERNQIRYYVWKNINSQYHAKISPFRLLWVNTKDIKKGLPLEKPHTVIEVRDGDWDLKAVDLFELDPRFRSLIAHFTEGVPWQETELYQSVLNLIKKKGMHYHKCTNEDELLDRLKKVDELYYYVKNHGYKTQSELYGGGWRGFVRRLNVPCTLEMREINVDIDRNGEILFVDGIHRLAVAYALNIEKVPVFVFIRHKKWQEYREYVYKNSNKVPENVKPHPDIMYLLNT